MTTARDREAFDEALARGSEQLKAGKLDQAQRSFRAALETDPGNARVLALLGLAYFRANQFAEARPIYEELVEKAGGDASHRLNLGLVYLKLNESEKAITSLEASRALDPSQGRAISYLGLAYARAGRYAEAYRSFLLAGQNELATEIEINLTAAERDGIHQQLGRTPTGPIAAEPPPVVSRTKTPPPPPQPSPPQPSPPPAAPSPAAPVTSSPETVIERPAATPPAGVAVLTPQAPRISEDSMLFVLPKADSVPKASGASMVSSALAAANPASQGAMNTHKTSGGTPPKPLTELATDELLRPDDGDEPFEISASGALIIRVEDRVFTRLDGVHITGGDLSYEVAMRRSRGHETKDRFDFGGTPLHAVSGSGYLVAVPGKQTFSAVTLDDDILYLREDLVFAFESTLRWESGNVPGMRGKLPVVQFRGDGALAVRLAQPLVRVKLASSGVVFVDAERLAGWIGRVIPRAVVPPADGPMGAMCVECTGEGIVLVEPRPDKPAAAVVIAAPPPAPVIEERPKPPPPPQPQTPAEIDPELDMSEVNAVLEQPLASASTDEI
ncbi:MAG: tetratricopeptide repeat protein [Kofleriaceae bacterium]|nr:tetratricopeptide repeat protein [Kofleriaceae bacterium]